MRNTFHLAAVKWLTYLLVGMSLILTIVLVYQQDSILDSGLFRGFISSIRHCHTATGAPIL